MKRGKFKLFSCLVLATVILASLVACAEPEPTTTTPAPTTPAPTTPTPTTPTPTTPTPTTPAPTTPAPGTPKYGGTLRVIYPYMGTALGWPADSRGGSSLYQQICLEPLLQQLMDGTIVPRLATSYTAAPDRTSITFTLRKGVKFHDGTDFNAQAVKFNFDAVIAAKKSSTVYWDSVDVIDDYTIRVNLNKWVTWIDTNFTFQGTNYIVSPTAYEENGVDWMADNMVGTGPFKQVDYERDDHIFFEKNTDYWQTGKPYVDRLEALCVVDPMTQQASFMAGEADILNSEADQKTADMRTKGYQVISRDVGVANLFPDSNNPDSPLANQKVREAIDYALDKAPMGESLTGGFWTPAYQMAPPYASAYNPNLPDRKYDPDKAKQLLEEAGYPDGFKIDILPAPVKVFNDLAVAIQGDLAKVGITANAVLLTDAKFGEYVMGTWHNGFIFGAVSSAVPNWMSALSGFFSPDSPTFQSMAKSQQFVDLWNAAATSSDYDPVKVQAVIKQMYDEEMVIALFNCAEAWVYQDYVHDAFNPWPSGLQQWSPANAWLDK